MNILAINPGSTSTKVVYFDGEAIVYEEKLRHTAKERAAFPTVMSQLDFRRQIVLDFMKKYQINPKTLDAVVGRGGILPPVQAGAYQVNEEMIHFLKYETTIEHPSNLGALLANEIAKKGKKDTLALIYDPVSVDQFEPVARISGLKGIKRKSLGHALNMRAVAMRVCEEQERPYTKANVIVVHLGGGNSISLHHHGRMIDSISDDEGPFSTERTGGLPLKEVIRVCDEKSPAEMLQLYRRQGGLLSYAGTSDARKIEAEIAAGNQELALVYEAFIYQIAKGIGSLAPIVHGDIDFIALTGGVAFSRKVVEGIRARTKFIAPLIVKAGEHEMIALCQGAKRVVLGTEVLHPFTMKESEENHENTSSVS